MSLNVALSTASRSLRALETQMAVSSANISNADTDGYTRKSATKVTDVTAGVGTGATISAIVSKVDPWLLKSIVATTSTKEAASVDADYLDRLGDALGSLSSDSASSGGTLATSLSSLSSALTELATTPESATLKSEVVGDLDDAAAALRTTSSEVQGLRQAADSDIADAVDTANTALSAIDALNDSIVRAKASGQSTADLEDQRMNKVADLSAVMGVSYFTQANGAMVVYTSGGAPLLNSSVHTLSFDEAGTVTSSATYPGGLSGITLDGTDITSTIKSGSVAALVTMRDKTLPAIQTQLDSLATGLRDTINSVYNNGTASPPPNSLSGSVTGLDAASALTATGNLSVAVTDSSGKTVAASTFDLSGYSDLGSLVSAINSAGLGLTAAIDSTTGSVSLTANNASNGVALSGGSVSSLDGTARSPAQSLSAALGLNDLLSGSGAETIAVRSDILATPDLLATSSLNTGTAALTAGGVAVSAGSGSQVQALADAINSAGLAGKAGNVVSGVSSRLSAAKEEATSQETTLSTLTSSFSSKYGVNVDEESATISALENSYSASAQVISTAKSMFDALLQAVR
ncbi:flagellar hook-associated protein FlgK [Magnetospirillum fulvum]|uniref:Flagellar hook-associated protein 1 n=1 Tax=Magnetospirillum fulvum MGU-K5 TaxID=1316936 RepID=S9TJ06_MAGFU|nr:flagellar hook-associated protein FlgK [Magnetospirillum fulvum]EPY02201.1 flagellar hook-associated protein FlgK [Magnetospirillum fulvum MGU-K5]